jgi:SOS-response transcriptional repressor LexA
MSNDSRSTIRGVTLSPRQRDLCDTVERLTAERGFGPSLVELAAALNVHPTRAKSLADEAVRRGFLTHDPRVARSWRVVRHEDKAAG